MSRKIELLAPGGDIDSIKSAVLAGANAVYVGLNKFNARNRADNISLNDLNGILHFAHKYNCEVFLTLNICIVESEFPDLIRLLNKLVNTSIDGVIIQDLGLFYLINHYFPSLNIHASTQLTTHNKGQLKFLKQLCATRVNLSREMNLDEIKHLSSEAHKIELLTEVFVHGSYCISFSGICYMSAVQNGNSGNRGRCSQPCRDEYKLTQADNNYPLNLKDNSAFFDIKTLFDAGVDSLKIEGRIKKFHYVHSVVEAYQNQLSKVYAGDKLCNDNSVLYKVFNRDFTNGYLKNDIHKNMFIDNPRDYSSTHLAKQNGGTTPENIDKAEQALYAEKGLMRRTIKSKIDAQSIAQIPLSINVIAQIGKPLIVKIKSSDKSFALKSDCNIAPTGSMPLSVKMLMKRFKAINETEYAISSISIDSSTETFIPFKALTSLKNEILLRLRNFKTQVDPVEIAPNKHYEQIEKPNLCVLIDTAEELELVKPLEQEVFFQLPNHIEDNLAFWITLFRNNANLIPLFPAILIGNNFDAHIELLRSIQAKKIVTNNSGIAHEANNSGITWIAGPTMNTVNTFALLCLSEFTHCEGAFIGNELSLKQIKHIKKPKGFKLYYSIFHPIEMMTSRQCFFQTSLGCVKNEMDSSCLSDCSKNTSITDLKKNTSYLTKSKNEFNKIYHQYHYLNTDIALDVPHHFHGFMIDLREIRTESEIKATKTDLIQHFQASISGDQNATTKIHERIKNSTKQQYENGI